MNAAARAVAYATLGGTFARERGRLALAVLAIALGVALGYAIGLVNRAAIDEFAAGMAALSGDADLEVRGPRAGFDEALFAEVARVDGVALASPVVEVDAPVAGRDNTLRVIGIDALRAAAITPAIVGQADRALDLLAQDKAFVSPAAALTFALRVGEPIVLRAGNGDVRLTIGGFTADIAGQAFAVVDIAAVQDLFRRGGILTRIDVRLAAGADPAAVHARIAAKLPPGIVVVPPADSVRSTARLSRAYRVNLNVLALVALFTGALLVYSMQALSVARRRAQFALLRTLGLARARLLGLVLGEATAIGVAGALIGLPLGYAFAAFALAHFGADLGAGFFRGTAPRASFDVTGALLFGALGVGAAIAGSLVPAREAARAEPAQALKAGSAGVADAPLRSPWPALALIAIGTLATRLPPIADLPLPGYFAIAAMIGGTLLLLPRIVRKLLDAVPMLRSTPAYLAIAQLRGTPGQASVGLAAIVASVALLASMAIMVASFRHSLDDWLGRLLPADVYVRAGGGDTALLTPDDQRRLATVAGVRRVEFLRVQNVVLDPALPRVAVLARTLDDPVRRLPLEGDAQLPGPGEPPAIFISEAVRDLYGYAPGQRVEIPLAGRNAAFTVAGVWRDYARQQGALVIDRDRYIAVTGDRDANDAAVWLVAGVSLDAFREALAAAFPDTDRYTVTTAGEIRTLSLAVFDRTFAVTYALEVAAVAIGLAGLTASFGALVLARRREFGMLRHLGMTRRQIGAMLAIEGVAVSGVGVLTGMALGGVISLVLIHVVNRQSFHWSMDVAVPWSGLVVFALVLQALALIATRVAGRQATSDDAVRAVKDDW
ncbi:MAG: FtsX-like permease family protein [Casimicrobiaceae bacterium]